ncbi:hypothetical protein [Kitasatospora viridis]|uniref:DUF1877 family protein n=1 Tax=Kitasatospora viridis TaxID=281105 RepID=A0A561TT02_9ACTN|nr:hypothetical protein [Kitasatospora viridis]TWF90238.1 hypothetical protein FHX73_13282 [Kitasatospora viridis]
MGILCDYFRAPDAEAVRRVLELTEGSSPVIGEDAAFDGIDAKGIEPSVVLGQLIAAIEQAPFDPARQDTAVWPLGPEPGPGMIPDDDDPWSTGPWVFELDPRTCAALAGVADTDALAIATRWARAEELHPARPETLREVLDELSALARRAREADERVYCWICL